MASPRALSDEDVSLPPRTPPALPSSPPKTPRRKSIFGAVRTHMSVVRAVIRRDRSEGPSLTPGRTKTVKQGELYAWDAEDTPVASVNKSLGEASAVGAPIDVPPLPRMADQRRPQAGGNATEGVGGWTAAAAPPSPPSIPSGPSEPPPSSIAQKRRNFYMADEGGARTPSEVGDAPGGGSYVKHISQMSASTAATSPPLSGASQSREQQQKKQQQQQKQPQMLQQPESIPNLQASWSWSEQFFFSQDDESVSTTSPSQMPPQTQQNVHGVGIDHRHRSGSYPSLRPMNSVSLGPILEAGGDDDETCNNTIVEKVRQRSKKASRASTVGAFVTFLKALFGIGMLSNPAVLGEVGLLLGTFCHLFIVVGCAFSCYLLLAARQMAKMEVAAKLRREAERQEDHEMWRIEMERRAAQRAGRRKLPPPRKNTTKFPVAAPRQKSVASTIDLLNPLDNSEGSSHRTLLAANAAAGAEEDWTVAPVPLSIPLSRAGTSMIQPNEGWVHCRDALSNSVENTEGGPGAPPAANEEARLATVSCGNVQMTRHSPHSRIEGNISGSLLRSASQDRLTRSERSVKSQSMSVTAEHRRFSDKVHSNYIAMPPPPLEPPVPPKGKQAQVRLATYGDVAKFLAGKRASFFIVFTIVTVHLMFASGMVHLAVENLCYVIGWERLGWSYVEEYVEQEQSQPNQRHLIRRLGSGLGRQIGYEVMRRLGPSEDDEDDEEHESGSADNRDWYDNNASRSSDEEEYYLEWKGPDFIGRLAMAALLFPIIHGLLQIPSLTELATISTVGLLTYAFGCIGSMLYTAVVLTDGHPFTDHPDDMWKTKWSGIPTYVATTIYCIEGINLALPTVSSIEGVQRWGGVGLMRQNTCKVAGGDEARVTARKEKDRQDLSVFIVVGAVFLYGMVTLVVSWIGLAGGLGGGIGTIHGEDGCWDVTYCLNSSAVRFVYMLSLGIALVLTLPVILYPSTEMLEVWLDERNDERRRLREQMLAASSSPVGEAQLPRQPFWHSQKSLLPDDETVCTVSDTLSPRVLGIRHDDIEMRDLSCSTNGAGDYISPSCSVSPPSDTTSPMILNQDGDSTKVVNSPNSNNPNLLSPAGNRPENRKLKAKRKLKYWKLRMFLAFIISVIGTIEGSFPSVLKAAEVIRGVGLSIAGLIFPPLLYMSAVGGNFSVPMAAAMALLIGLGLFNIVLVLMSAFGAKDFIVEEGRGNFYEM